MRVDSCTEPRWGSGGVATGTTGYYRITNFGNGTTGVFRIEWEERA